MTIIPLRTLVRGSILLTVGFWASIVISQKEGPLLWALITLVVLAYCGLMFSAIRMAQRTDLRRRSGRCLACGYDLRASPGQCPECGTPASGSKVE